MGHSSLIFTAKSNGRYIVFLFKKDERITAVFTYCAIVIALMAVTPWIDWARYGDIWVANLAGLPALPAVFLIFKKSRMA